MPYDPKNPPADLVEKIKKRHPKATDSDVRQWIHVFNGTMAEEGDEEAAFRNAWGVLKKRLDPVKQAWFSDDEPVPLIAAADEPKSGGRVSLSEADAAAVDIITAGVGDYFPVGRADEHQLAAAGTGGRVVVAAGAGSGKTATMVSRIAYMQREQRVPPHNFLVCTFSSASAKDMEEKISAAVGGAAVRQMQVTTIDALCSRSLRDRQFGLVEGEVLDGSERVAGLTRTKFLKAIVGLWDKCTGEDLLGLSNLKLRDVSLKIDKFKGNLKTPADVCEEDDLFGFADIQWSYKGIDEIEIRGKRRVLGLLYELYECFKFGPNSPQWQQLKHDRAYWIQQFRILAEKAKQKVTGNKGWDAVENLVNHVNNGNPAMDFMDAQLAFMWHLQNNGGFKQALQQRYTQIFVDECQDTSPLQFTCIRALSDHIGTDDPKKSIWMVGDDKQSIYFFRGTKPQQFIDLSENPEWKLRMMPNNYRSTKAVVDMGNSLIAHNEKQIPMEAIAAGPNKDHEGEVELHRPDYAEDIPARVVGLIRAKEEEGTSFDDFAVIARTNAELGMCQYDLLVEGIPHVAKGGNFLNSWETRVLMGWLRVAVAGMPGVPSDPEALGKAAADIFNQPYRSWQRNIGRIKDALEGSRDPLGDIINASIGSGLMRSLPSMPSWKEDVVRSSFESLQSNIEKVQRKANEGVTTPELLEFILDNVYSWESGDKPWELEEKQSLREFLAKALSEKDDDDSAVESQGDEEETETGEGETEPGEPKIKQATLSIGSARILLDIANRKPREGEADATVPVGFFHRIEELYALSDKNEEEVWEITTDPRTGRKRRVKRKVGKEAVTLTTAHGAKGLEWDHVVCLFPKWKFPSARIFFNIKDAREAMNLGMDPEDPEVPLETEADWERAREYLQELEEEFEAERRLAYVAITRAKKNIFYMCPRISKNDKPLEVSEFVEEAQVVEHATYTEDDSPYQFDSIDEAIQAQLSIGNEPAAMALGLIRDAKTKEAARAIALKNPRVWDLVSDVRGLSAKCWSPIMSMGREWPTLEAVKNNVAHARIIFMEGKAVDPDSISVEMGRSALADELTVATLLYKYGYKARASDVLEGFETEPVRWRRIVTQMLKQDENDEFPESAEELLLEKLRGLVDAGGPVPDDEPEPAAVEDRHMWQDEEGGLHVDTWAVNHLKDYWRESVLHSMGFGEFYADTPQGRVDFDSMRGKPFDGMSGRPYKVSGDIGAVMEYARRLREYLNTRTASLMVTAALALPKAVLRQWLSEIAEFEDEEPPAGYVTNFTVAGEVFHVSRSRARIKWLRLGPAAKDISSGLWFVRQGADTNALADWNITIDDIQAGVVTIIRKRLFDVDVDSAVVERPTVKVEQEAHKYPVYKYREEADTDNISEKLYSLFGSSAPEGSFSPGWFVCEENVVVAGSIQNITLKRYKTWIAADPQRANQAERVLTQVLNHFQQLRSIHRKVRLELVAVSPAVERLVKARGLVEVYREKCNGVFSAEASDEAYFREPDLISFFRLEDSFVLTIPGEGDVEVNVTRDWSSIGDDDVESDYYVLEVDHDVPLDTLRGPLAKHLEIDRNRIRPGDDHNEFVVRCVG